MTTRRTVLCFSFIAVVGLLSAVRSLQASSPARPIDRAHSRVTFTVTKFGIIDVEGRFLDFNGTILYDPEHLDLSRVEWRVKVASVQTGETRRDQSLQGAEYFDAARFPELTFVSDRIVATGPSTFDVTGRLTIRGKTAPLTTHVTYKGNSVIPGEGRFDVFETSFTVNRYDFGVVGGSVLGSMISRDVRIALIAATNVPAAPARH